MVRAGAGEGGVMWAGGNESLRNQIVCDRNGGEGESEGESEGPQMKMRALQVGQAKLGACAMRAGKDGGVCGEGGCRQGRLSGRQHGSRR